MPNVIQYQPSFNAGELSPRMQGRGDFQKFQSGAAVVENMLALPQGGLSRRPSTRFVAEVKTSSLATKLLRFVFSTTQAYVLEAGNLYFRFYRNQGRISAANITGSISNGTFATDLTGWDDRDGGSGVSTWVGGTMNLNPTAAATTDYARREQAVTVTTALAYTLSFRVLGKAGDKVKLRVGTGSEGTQIVNDVTCEVGYHIYTFTSSGTTAYIGFTAYGSDQGIKAVQVDDVAFLDDVPLELVTPYATADLFDIKYAQTADFLYLVHPSYPVYKLTRSGHTSWSLTEVRWEDGPYRDVNTTATTLTPAAGTGNGIVFTASTQLGINNNLGFSTSDFGRHIRFRNASTEWLWGIIVSSSTTTATTPQVDILRASTSTAASTQWRLGAFSSTQGWPAAVGFFEQRLFLARTNDQPQSFWGSQSGEIENQRPDSLSTGVVVVEDDDALDFTIASEEVNAIRWLSPGTVLAMGTDGGEYVINSDGAFVTPSDVNVRRHTVRKCANIQPVRVDHAVLFAQKGLRKINEFAFRFEVDGFVSPDLTLLSDHILKSRIVEMTYQGEPDSVLWAVRTDGQMATMTYRRDQDVVGWGRQIFGGAYQGGIAQCESAVTIPGTNGSGQTENSEERDELWVIVLRTINGSTERYVEFLEKPFEGVRREDYTSDTAYDNAQIKEQRHSYFADSLLTRDTNYTITGATAANPVVVTTSSAHGMSNGDLVRIDDVVGMTEINYTVFKVANIAATTFELTTRGAGANVSGTSYTAYISGGLARPLSTSVTGLSHLEGLSVTVNADGAHHPNKTVTSGAITLDYAAAVVQVGLAYTSTWKSLRLVPQTAFGSGLGKTKRAGPLTLLFLDSVAPLIGPDTDNMTQTNFRESADLMNTPTPMFTGDFAYDFDGDWGTDPRIVIQSSVPLPLTILGISAETKVNM